MTEQLGWVPTRSGDVFAGLHLPSGPARSTAVVLVPPFGWEGVSAGRNLRAWARDLAASGYPTVRYQPPGAGDSSGQSGSQDLATWSEALTDVVAHTRKVSGCKHLTVIGLGLGGLIALQSAHDGAEIDDLALWSTPAKGRLLLRELRAFAAMTAEPGEPSVGAPQPIEAVTTQDGMLWVHGYPIGVRAQTALQDLDVAALDLSHLARVLILGRGTLPADKKLVESLTAAGADVVTSPGPGYDELTVEPRLSQPAREVMRTVQMWLRPEQGNSKPGLLEVAITGEERLDLGQVDAILTRAEDAVVTAVFIGAGAIARSGPNRLWAEAARRWAPWGITSLRLDLFSIGEAPGPDAYPHGPEGFYDESYRPQILAVLDEAVRRGLPDRFLLVGLCSGGFWSAQVALDDPRVAGVIVLNAVSLVWPPPLFSAKNRGYLRSKETWNRFLHDPRLRKEALLQARRSAALAVAHLRKQQNRPLVSSFDVLTALRDAGVPVAVGASPGEDMLADLALLPSEPRLVTQAFAGPEGAHTLSTAGLREQAQVLMDTAAREAVAAVRAAAVAR